MGHVPDTGGVYFVPEFHTPNWQPGTRRYVAMETDCLPSVHAISGVTCETHMFHKASAKQMAK